MVKQAVVIMALLAVILGCLCAYLIGSSLVCGYTLKVADKINQKELEKVITNEKKLIKKEFEKKYAADIISYAAMAKRLELERDAAKRLENKVKALEKKEGE